MWKTTDVGPPATEAGEQDQPKGPTEAVLAGQLSGALISKASI
jgi:hypothetical protein